MKKLVLGLIILLCGCSNNSHMDSNSSKSNSNSITENFQSDTNEEQSISNYYSSTNFQNDSSSTAGWLPDIKPIKGGRK